MKLPFRAFLFLLLILLTPKFYAQDKPSDTLFSGLEFRNLGPAFTSGRIADIAIHPKNENIWYVAVGSGGVWKTNNSGTTWTPIFDKQTSYSIGCITIDTNNPSTIWVGTGENVGGRHVGFGDGIYKSLDDGETWQNLGLTNTEHISKIIVHPNNSDIVWVAAQGPLWSSGGDRGVYKTIDGGKTWHKTLGDSVWTGATDLLIDPNNPDILYAATWDRHRTVAAYMGGGPGSGIHKSTDGGQTWKKLSKGIPSSNLGKIGLAISAFDSKTIYAAIELDRRKGGVFVSKNGGESWSKQSDAVSGGTGPHYYQELYASPHHEGYLYLMSNNVLISKDDGITFEPMNEKNKHVDSHALAFKNSDPNYLIFGTDGGLYETFDHTTTWKYINNLPITQYYKLAVDDSKPFYNIYGGTQDNGSHGGPSQTKSSHGIVNSDWWVTLFADGHQSATEPGNPNITYGEFQEGVLWRIDQTTKETVFIQPQPRDGEPNERFNWDAPILVSPHNPTRIYFASYRVWRSDNRGDKWLPISNDLTKNEDRVTLPIMGKQQSWDNAWDVYAMSMYNTITSLAESPIQEGLLYAGTDDGLIQITENGGIEWRKFEVGSIKGIPKTAFVNDIRADLFDANVVYAALDNHKYGDFKPYLIKSDDKGKSWYSMNGDLPKRLITWRLVQDHIKKDLLFAATEFGIYMTYNSGKNWTKLTGGLPTISFRDLTIQRRENDLVAASFGRGFFILDDMSPIREFNSNVAKQSATMFSIKPAYLYIQTGELYGQGDNYYKAKNPPFGAVFTYYLKDKFKSRKEIRQQSEKETKNTHFPGWQAIEKETREEDPKVMLFIKDSNGKVVNIVEGSNKKGFNRANWRLNYPDKKGVKLDEKISNSGITLVTPGTYTVTLATKIDGVLSELTDAIEFDVVPLQEGYLKGKPSEEIESFRESFNIYSQDLNATNTKLSKDIKIVNAMEIALNSASNPNKVLYNKIYLLKMQLLDIEKQLSGDKTKGEIGEQSNPTANTLSYIYASILKNSTYGPTENHLDMFNLSKKRLNEVKTKLKDTDKIISQLVVDLKQAGAPWIEGTDH